VRLQFEAAEAQRGVGFGWGHARCRSDHAIAPR
jgi:hypothetical protein